jgi:hypothetical protein
MVVIRKNDFVQLSERFVQQNTQQKTDFYDNKIKPTVISTKS